MRSATRSSSCPRKRRKDRWVSILACAVAWTVCLPLGFERLVLIDIILYGVALLLEFIALVVLRLREPDLPRRFRAPGGIAGAAALGIGPAALLVLTFVRGESERTGPITALGLGAILGLLGVLVYFAVRGRARINERAAAEISD